MLVIIAGTYVAYRIERPQKLRKYRFKMGLCVCCGYNLRGNASRVCPECGTPRVRMPP